MPSEILVIIWIFNFELQFKLQDVIPKFETTLNASGPLVAIATLIIHQSLYIVSLHIDNKWIQKEVLD